MKTIAKVKEVKVKNKGFHTVLLVMSTTNKHGMVMNSYAFTKMAKAPRKGQKFTLENVQIEQSSEGFNWLKGAE